MSTNLPPNQPPYGNQQGYQPPPGAPYYPPPAKKKVSPIVWILGGLGAFVILIAIAVAGAGFFLVHKAKQAGLDPDLMRRNPALATVKMMAALTPNIEVQSIDEGRGIVTVRDKKEGKTFTVNLEDAKKGRFVFQEDGKDAVTLNATGDGKTGAVEIKSAEGTVKIGGGQNAKVPTWIPDYPRSEPTVAYSAQSKDGDSGSYQFKTKDPSDKVAKFYEDGLKSSGMKVTTTLSTSGGSGTGGMIVGEDEDKKHSAIVLLGSEEGSTTVSVTFTVKK
jgi:hypothetical protein